MIFHCTILMQVLTYTKSRILSKIRLQRLKMAWFRQKRKKSRGDKRFLVKTKEFMKNSWILNFVNGVNFIQLKVRIKKSKQSSSQILGKHGTLFEEGAHCILLGKHDTLFEEGTHCILLGKHDTLFEEGTHGMRIILEIVVNVCQSTKFIFVCSVTPKDCDNCCELCHFYKF